MKLSTSEHNQTALILDPKHFYFVAFFVFFPSINVAVWYTISQYVKEQWYEAITPPSLFLVVVVVSVTHCSATKHSPFHFIPFSG